MRIIGQQHFKKHARQTSAKQAVLSTFSKNCYTVEMELFYSHNEIGGIDHCIIFNELVWRSLLRTSIASDNISKRKLTGDTRKISVSNIKVLRPSTSPTRRAS